MWNMLRPRIGTADIIERADSWSEQAVRIIAMDRTRRKVAVASLVLVALLLSGCASATSSNAIAPASDKPTFLYFFTDG